MIPVIKTSQCCVWLNSEELQLEVSLLLNLPHSVFSSFSLGLFKAKRNWVGVGAVGLAFTPSVELNPSLCLAYTLHITRFGLSSLFSGAAVGLAMATATSGIRHFIRPPLSAANWLCFYKQASSQPANTRWHSLISVSPDRRNTYGGKKGEIWIAIS